ncbi:hypothetical protein PF003_g14305 [Phytophthora fragariae]|nr:hypothetical protein PF003_g14305 [Phytophthora fragariae]
MPDRRCTVSANGRRMEETRPIDSVEDFDSKYRQV